MCKKLQNEMNSFCSVLYPCFEYPRKATECELPQPKTFSTTHRQPSTMGMDVQPEYRYSAFCANIVQ